MQTLTCEQCGQDWTRAPVRGRKPRLCPTCRDGVKAPEAAPEPQEQPATEPKPKRRRKSKWEKLTNEKAKALPPLDERPFCERTSGWCTDYDPAPEAQHAKCDGDLGKYRCPCDCHDWS